MLFSSFAKMAFRFCFTNFAIMALFLALSHQTTLGKTTTKERIKCEALDKTKCAFAISSSGKRCVLETVLKRSREVGFVCRTSKIKADHLRDIVETERCILGCGLDRDTLGLVSPNSLLDPVFVLKLCSSICYNECSNIIDLFFNLAAHEGISLPKLCGVPGRNVRRKEIKSTRINTQKPVHTVSLSIEPTTKSKSGQSFSSSYIIPTTDRRLTEVDVEIGDAPAPTPAPAPAPTEEPN